MTPRPGSDLDDRGRRDDQVVDAAGDFPRAIARSASRTGMRTPAVPVASHEHVVEARPRVASSRLR